MSIGISLGWKCDSAVYGVKNNIRKIKEEGYNTCVFDEMVSNYVGLLMCIEDDFKYFLDTNYIEIRDIGEPIIYNTKYNFWFNHESPGHANLYITQNWSGGINHYINNNYEKFIERYKTRINNFRNYINSGNKINFIIDRYKTTSIEDIKELDNLLKIKYPLLNYNFIFVPPKNNFDCILRDFKIMFRDDPQNEELLRIK